MASACALADLTQTLSTPTHTRLRVPGSGFGALWTNGLFESVKAITSWVRVAAHGFFVVVAVIPRS